MISTTEDRHKPDQIFYMPLRGSKEGVYMKLYYNDNGTRTLVVEVLTNHSMSIDDMLGYVDMDEWAAEQGMEDWDYEALELEA